MSKKQPSKNYRKFTKTENRSSAKTTVAAKKHLGQHFLEDEEVAEAIGNTLSCSGYKNCIEIGPGMGVLTKYLLQKDIDLIAMDLDTESIGYLNSSFALEFSKYISGKNIFEVIEADFLKYNLDLLFPGEEFAITGNFPYNISSQIVFRTLDNRARIPEFTGMFQKEVAKRICAGPGSKTYGIISVLTQAFYDAEYLFTVPPTVFNPPPKVDSGVLRLRRKANFTLPCEEKLLYTVVKTAFNQRRKTLRNSLKSVLPEQIDTTDSLFSKRPEQLEVAEFIELTIAVEKYQKSI